MLQGDVKHLSAERVLCCGRGQTGATDWPKLQEPSDCSGLGGGGGWALFLRIDISALLFSEEKQGGFLRFFSAINSPSYQTINQTVG